MRPITEEDEQNLDKWECINVDGKRIDKKDIYCYGEINLSSNDDVEYIKKFSLLDTQTSYSNHPCPLPSPRLECFMGYPLGKNTLGNNFPRCI